MEITSKLDPKLNSVTLQVLEFIRQQNDERLSPTRIRIRMNFKDISTPYINCVIGRLLSKGCIKAIGTKMSYAFIITHKGILILEAYAKAEARGELLTLIEDGYNWGLNI